MAESRDVFLLASLDLASWIFARKVQTADAAQILLPRFRLTNCGRTALLGGASTETGNHLDSPSCFCVALIVELHRDSNCQPYCTSADRAV